MPLKPKSTFKKSEFEYESPDGDNFKIVYIESEDRKYVEIGRVPKDGEESESPVRWDYDMLMDLANTLRQVNRPQQVAIPRTGFPMPNIVDHRTVVPTKIDQTVSKSMQKMDESVDPIESFDPEHLHYHVNATGVIPGDEDEVPDTPEGLKGWADEASHRKAMVVDPLAKEKNRIKRVDPNELI